MAYSITYGSDRDLKRYQRKDRFGLIAFAFVAALIAGIRIFLPDVFETVINILNPLDDRGVSAFHTMVDNVQQGTPVGEAVDAFCRSIIENADIWG